MSEFLINLGASIIFTLIGIGLIIIGAGMVVYCVRDVWL